MAPAISGAFAQAQATLPGGASSLRETYQDWLVACVQKKTKRCALSQQQSQENGRRVLGVEIVPGPDGKTATGILVLPFGLALDAGVTLQIDDKPAEAPLRFSTCLSGGCLVPLSFDEAFLSALRAGEALKATAKAFDGGQAVSLSVSLKGFSAAFDRVAVLVK
jgi:invasion protein IalB